MNKANEKKLGLGLLISLGIGSMIASGIFNSPTDLITNSNPQAVTISWGIGVLGAVMLALVFSMLTERYPNLKGGIYSYARAGYGDFVGFNSAWGYWLSSFLGNGSFIILIFKTLNSLIGYEIPAFLSFLIGSLILWSYYFIIKNGIKEAGILNAIITIAKIIPLLLVIVLGALVFNFDIFNVPNWQSLLASSGKTTTLSNQINGAMGTILWCFIGVEALVVLSERAESQKLVSKATVLALFLTASLYILISTISMGIIPANILINSQTPLADVLAKTPLGSFGGTLVKCGILISNIGALLCWNLITTEILYVPTIKDGLMPKWFNKTNEKDVPVNALFFTIMGTQIVLLALLSPALQKGYYTATHMATTNILIPYLICSMFAFKTYRNKKNNLKEKIISLLAIVYSLYVIYAVGISYLGLAFIMYSLGIFVYIKAKHEKNENILSKEKIYISLMVTISIIMLIFIFLGKISI